MMFDAVRQVGTSILASAGMAGITLGFAARKTLGNLLAGIQIALSQPILIEDVVIVEGEFGRIEDITLTVVSVRTWDLRRLIVPIAYLIENRFRIGAQIRAAARTIFLYLDYQVPLGELREELKRLEEKNKKWDREVCKLQVTETKPNTIEVRALVSSANAGLGVLSALPDARRLDRISAQPLSQKPAAGSHGFDAARRISTNERPHTALVEGQEHERGPSAPGLEAEKL